MVFVNETLKMKELSHPNVMNLWGTCIDAGPTTYIVLMYMANSDLLLYIRKQRNSLLVSSGDDIDDSVASARHYRYNTSALCFIVDCHYQSKRTCFTFQWRVIPNLLWYWPKSTIGRTVQMYCSDVSRWLWRADATESYVQGPRTGKCCKLEVQNSCCCSVSWNMLYTR